MLKARSSDMVSPSYMPMSSALSLFPFQSVVAILAPHNYACLKWNILRLSVLLLSLVTIETCVAM
jgi:hypothetical protein